MIRTQVSLDPAAYDDLRAEASRLQISIAELVRRAIDGVLANRPNRKGRKANPKPWMRHAGSLASGDSDASRSVNAVVYGRSKP